MNEMKFVKGIKQLEGELELIVRGGTEVIPRIVETAAASGVRVDSISLREPTLEDVFLHYTGRMIREEGGEEYHGLAAIKRRSIR